MLKAKVYDEIFKPSDSEKGEIVNFIYEHLEECGDPKSEILKAIDYSVKEFNSFGGSTIKVMKDNTIVGATVVNETGMGGYIPENILVYIAIHSDYRGSGYGKVLLQNVIDNVKGDIALHAEANDPAMKLYENFGFTNPYLEMRLKK